MGGERCNPSLMRYDGSRRLDDLIGEESIQCATMLISSICDDDADVLMHRPTE